MKKVTKQIGNYLLLILFVFTSSCEKDRLIKDGRFEGEWVSNDLIDTIRFENDSDLYKRIDGIEDHFDYSYTKDSITITYNGYMMVGRVPSTLKYELKNDNLTIDFRECWFGFRREIIDFSKE